MVEVIGELRLATAPRQQTHRWAKKARVTTPSLSLIETRFSPMLSQCFHHQSYLNGPYSGSSQTVSSPPHQPNRDIMKSAHTHEDRS